MTDNAPAIPDPNDLSDFLPSEGLEPVDPAFTHVLRIHIALNAIPLAIGATIIDNLLIERIDGPFGLMTVLGWLLAVIAIVTIPSRRAQRWGFHMAEDRLRVARGWLVRTDTIVPFVRVQHIDVGQGPIERLFNLSHLVVHTSGTHNSTVTLPGLHGDLAAAMRETIRHHIQTDFA